MRTLNDVIWNDEIEKEIECDIAKETRASNIGMVLQMCCLIDHYDDGSGLGSVDSMCR